MEEIFQNRLINILKAKGILNQILQIEGSKLIEKFDDNLEKHKGISEEEIEEMREYLCSKVDEKRSIENLTKEDVMESFKISTLDEEIQNFKEIRKKEKEELRYEKYKTIKLSTELYNANSRADLFEEKNYVRERMEEDQKQWKKDTLYFLIWNLIFIIPVIIISLRANFEWYNDLVKKNFYIKLIVNFSLYIIPLVIINACIVKKERFENFWKYLKIKYIKKYREEQEEKYKEEYRKK